MGKVFTPGEYEAARLYIAVMTKHVDNLDFAPAEIGFTFSVDSDSPMGISANGEFVTTKDFIKAALKIMHGQVENLSRSIGISSGEIISHLGLSVAKENPEDT
jgi:hypothetical protein